MVTVHVRKGVIHSIGGSEEGKEGAYHTGGAWKWSDALTDTDWDNNPDHGHNIRTSITVM